MVPHPSASPYEYDFISNENMKYDIRNTNALTIPSFQTSHVCLISKYFHHSSTFLQSPIRRSSGNTLPRVNSSTSHLSSILTNELSPSTSFCVSTLSGEIPSENTTTMNANNPKMAHLLYFLQTLENVSK